MLNWAAKIYGMAKQRAASEQENKQEWEEIFKRKEGLETGGFNVLMKANTQLNVGIGEEAVFLYKWYGH
jgi:hypothetical protein